MISIMPKIRNAFFYIREKGIKWLYNYVHFILFYDTINPILIKYLQWVHPYPSYIEVECTTKCPLKCLAKNTRIKTKKGEVLIQDLKVGDNVYSYNIDENKISNSVVLGVVEHEEKKSLYEIVLENGEILKLTGEHLILTSRGWIETKKISMGEEVHVFDKDRTSWNKGLTKETDERIKRIGEKIGKAQKEKYERGAIPWNKGKTKETNKTLAETGRKISKALKGRESIFKGHNFGLCKKCGKYHRYNKEGHDWSKGHNYKGICKKCGKHHFPDDFFEKQSKRMKEDNPMFKQENIDKMMESTDYGKLGELVSLTIQKKKDKGIYKPSMLVLKEENIERYDEIRKDASYRMKVNNPMFDPETVQRCLRSMSKLRKEGKIKYVPMNEENRTKQSERMKINNPMFNEKSKEMSIKNRDILEIGKKISITINKLHKEHPEIGRGISKKLKENWKDKEYALRIIKSLKRRPNFLEINFLMFCKENGFLFEYVGDGSFWFYGEVSKRCRNPDFINKETKKVILVGAYYWHSNEEEEKLELEDYMCAGFSVLHIWEDEFYNDKLLVKSKVEEFLKE